MQGTPAPGLMVLSMHQPWASLLVFGLKRIEGRAWPTDYTGRLWIHATSTKPTAKEIEVLLTMHLSLRGVIHRSCTWRLHVLQEMQSFYRQIHEAEGRDITPNVPASYPTSVLIGCVDVVACFSVSFYAQVSAR